MLGDSMENRDSQSPESGDEEGPSNDPTRDQRIRLQTKAKLQSILGDVRKTRTQGTINSDYVKKTIDALDQNMGNVKYAQEACMDAQVILELTSFAAEDAQKRTSGAVAFNMAQFMKAVKKDLLQEVDDGEEISHRLDWSALSDSTMQKMPLKVPTLDFMLGPLSLIPVKKVMKERAKREKFDESQKVRPQTGVQAERAAEQVTTRMVYKLTQIIKRQQEPISYFRFVIDPNDFAQTVENIFHLAFVVKEGRAEIRLDDDGLPVIVSADPYEEMSTDEVVHKKQVLTEIDMDQFEALIEAFHITDSFLGTYESDDEDDDDDEEDEEGDEGGDDQDGEIEENGYAEGHEDEEVDPRKRARR